MGDWWAKGEMLWRFLKRYTAGEAKRVVIGVREDNGWEAWRKLHLQFEPGMVMREAMVMASFTSMVTKRAKNASETRTLMVELEDRAKRVEDITGEPIEGKHEMSVIMGILDQETLKHTAQYQGAKADVKILKRKILEFVNLVSSGSNKGDAMDLDRCEEKGEENKEEPADQGEEDEEWPYEGIHGLGEKCYECGGFGHYARECPNKGKGKGKGPKGKGKGKGGDKGYGGFGTTKGQGKSQKGQGKRDKGKGKGQAPQFGSCWNCGGNHYVKDCMQGQGGWQTKGGGSWQPGGIRSLCGLCEASTVATLPGVKHEEPCTLSRQVCHERALLGRRLPQGFEEANNEEVEKEDKDREFEVVKSVRTKKREKRHRKLEEQSTCCKPLCHQG